MTDNLPQAISESELRIGDVTLRCYVLDDGRRIFNADDVAALFASWEDGGVGPSDADISDLVTFIRKGAA